MRADRAQVEAAKQLVGKRVQWARAHPGVVRQVMTVEEATADGMVSIVGYVGLFAPHLFRVVDGDIGGAS